MRFTFPCAQDTCTFEEVYGVRFRVMVRALPGTHSAGNAPVQLQGAASSVALQPMGSGVPASIRSGQEPDGGYDQAYAQGELAAEPYGCDEASYNMIHTDGLCGHTWARCLKHDVMFGTCLRMLAVQC